MLIIFGMHVGVGIFEDKNHGFSPKVVTGLAITYGRWCWVANAHLLKPQGGGRSHINMGSGGARVMSHQWSDIGIHEN